MTEVEAIKVIEIMLTADGGCRDCASVLIWQFNELFPKFKPFADSLFNEKFPKQEIKSPIAPIISFAEGFDPKEIKVETHGGGGSK